MGGISRKIPKVKLFCGLLFSDRSVADNALAVLRGKYGRPDLLSDVFVFDQTGYYAAEMGTDLKRIFVSFGKLIGREKISSIKAATNRLELRLSSGGPKRIINIDPGYVTEANVSLATTKDFQHRVYVGKGIFLENTLRFRRGGWEDWEWTYKDYRTAAYKQWFARVREIYRKQLKA